MSGNDKSKALRVLRFLTELARLRTKTVNDLADYPHVIWCSSLPKTGACFTRAWGESDDHDPEIWLEVKKMREPPHPTVPQSCRDWVEGATVGDSSTVPSLRDRILVPLEQQPAHPESSDEELPDADGAEEALFRRSDEISEDDSDPISAGEQTAPRDGDDSQRRRDPAADALSEANWLDLVDHPEVSEEWGAYLENEWQPWSQRHKQWLEVHRVYSELFELFQSLQVRGEQVELVMGVGLLTWILHGNRRCRHLVTGKVDLSFEPERGVFTVRPAPDGVELTPELDMIDSTDRPLNAEEDARAGLMSAGENLWDRAAIDTVLSSIAHSLADRGEYRPDTLARTTRAADSPIVEFAPALILRKRSSRGVIETLEKMRALVEGDCDTPEAWRDLCETSSSNIEQESSHEPGREGGAGTVYFPLLSNDEQRRIITILESKMGALVQGPPGTGKSHTIANLICHLLATGKRILITAQTPRALQVLKDKLPPEMQPLCVSLLGTGVEEQKSLEASVLGMTSRQDSWNKDTNEAKIQQWRKQREQLNKELAKLRREYRSIREAETFEHVICGYSGTAAKIAKQLQSDSGELGWIEDEVPLDAKINWTAEDVIRLRQLLVEIDASDERRLSQIRPIPGKDIPSVSEFADQVEARSDASSVLSEEVSKSAEAWQSDLAVQDVESVKRLVDDLSRLSAAIANIEKRPLPWIAAAVQGVLAEQDRPWIELHETTRQQLSGLLSRTRAVDARTISIPADRDRLRVRHDAIELAKHLRTGKGLGWWTFRAGAVKAGWYLITECHVNGMPCRSVEALELLIDAVDVEEEVNQLWRAWDGKAARTFGQLTTQVAELEEHFEALSSVVVVYEKLENTKKTFAELVGVHHPAWHDAESRTALLAVARRRIASDQLQVAERAMGRTTERLSLMAQDSRADKALITDVLVAVRAQDRVKYSLVCQEMERLASKAAELEWRRTVESSLSDVMPRFLDALRASSNDESWNARLLTFSKAVHHAQARSAIQGLAGDGDADGLSRQIDRTEVECRTLLEREAVALAWNYCFGRLTDRHRRSLMGWQQAMKKVGKGLGKHAYQHKRNAQLNLGRCRDAIPAWVMPLHRVYDTIDPLPGMFDVVIVDEASQCGPDAMPLFFLGKKVLIVGDDQQISPSNIGVKRDDVFQRITELLDDFDYRDAFDIDTSLFDQGVRRFGNRVVLREHFRCMPEIIRFSNDLCYQNSPLIALREYPPDRLEPLQRRFVETGFRDGVGSRAINVPEAEALAQAVVGCCSDPRYTRDGEKLTMGVIALQGTAQAQQIEALLVNELGAEEMATRRLVCGDAYSFQGDERDIVFLSMVAAPNERVGALTKAADQRRFNVAASRARDQLWLFHSVTQNDLSEKCVRRFLLEYFLNPSCLVGDALGSDLNELRQKMLTCNQAIEKPPVPFESWFEVEVALDIVSRGYRIVPQFEKGGYRVDLVVEGSRSRLAVECDGDEWHGADRYESDLARQQKLERAGLRFWRVRGSRYYANQAKAMAPLWDLLDSMGIEPLSRASHSGEETCSAASVYVEDLDGQASVNVPSGIEMGCVVEQEDSSESGHDGLSQARDRSSTIAEQQARSTEAERVADSGREDHSVASASSMIVAAPYQRWASRELPDPRTAAMRHVIDGLREIVKAEGPMLCLRAYQLYAKSFGAKRVGSELRRCFNRAMHKAIRSGLIVAEDEMGEGGQLHSIVRLKGSERVLLRELGDRTVLEIPPSEIFLMMSSVEDELGQLSDEALFKETLNRYGIQRLRAPTKQRLLSIKKAMSS